MLLAEDKAVNSEIIATMLSDQGYVVTTVADGAKAIAAVTAAGAFDLVLMDLQMRIMDGLTATATIRTRAPPGGTPIPIIGLTANAMDEDVERCLTAGMDAHLAKPIRWPAPFATIERDLDAHAYEVAPSLPVRLATMLGLFEEELRRRLESFGAETPPVLAEAAHAIAGTAGHFGFVSLSRLCSRIEAAARRNQGPDQAVEL